MDRREFLKWCSAMVVAQGIVNCNFFDDEKSVSEPTLKDFENEIQLAISKSKKTLNLVPIAPPGPLKFSETPSINRFGMAIDLDLCNGCGKCILACILENNISLASKKEQEMNKFKHWIELRGAIPVFCYHCGDAPCEKVCPTGAASHTPDGLSTMMYKRCAGSRYCGANCPIGVRKFNYSDPIKEHLTKKFNSNVPIREKGVMEKCSLCIQRLQDDKLSYLSENPKGNWRGNNVKTACELSCPKNAIIFGNWLDSNSPLVLATKHRRLFAPIEVSKLNPSVVYMGGSL